MEYIELFNFAKSLLLTNGGIAIFIFVIYSIVHSREHKKEKQFYEHHCTEKEVLKDIQIKINKYIWKFESEEAKEYKNLLDHIQSENDLLMNKINIDLREYIRKTHRFDIDPIKYGDELFSYINKIWKDNREERPLLMDISIQEKLMKVNKLVIPMIRVVVFEIIDVILNKELNGKRESVVDATLLKGIKSIQDVWRACFENEFRR